MWRKFYNVDLLGLPSVKAWAASAVGNVTQFGWWVSFSPLLPPLFSSVPSPKRRAFPHLHPVHRDRLLGVVRPSRERWLGWGTDACGRDLPVNPQTNLLPFFCISWQIFTNSICWAMLPLKHCFYSVLFFSCVFFSPLFCSIWRVSNW